MSDEYSRHAGAAAVQPPRLPRCSRGFSASSGSVGPSDHEFISQQPEGIADNDEGAAFVHKHGRTDPDDACRRSQDEECNDGHRQPQVLPNDCPRLARQPNGERQASKIVGHERDIGRFERCRGAGAAHGNAYSCLRQRWRIIDAITDHRNGAMPS